MSIKIITPPATEPVTLEEALLHCRIDGTTENAMITALITAAREHCEEFQNKAYITQTLELGLDGWPCFPVKIPRPPLVSVASIKYYDTTNTEYTLSPASYFVDADSEPGRVALAHGVQLPTTSLREIGAVKIRYTAGAATAPKTVNQAVLMLVGFWYENRETAKTFTNPEEMPYAVRDLLRPSRVIPS